MRINLDSMMTLIIKDIPTNTSVAGKLFNFPGGVNYFLQPQCFNFFFHSYFIVLIPGSVTPLLNMDFNKISKC